MHELPFRNQRALGADELETYAARIGLDVGRWERDVASPAVQAQVDAEQNEGAAAEVRGTPSFIVAGKLVVNRSYDGFRQMIDAALKRG